MKLRANSIVTRIAALHILAVAVACVAMPLALYLRLNAAVSDMHEHALDDQARELANHLTHDERGWHLSLPLSLQDTYSVAYGRYAYAIVDTAGKTLFSSLNSGNAVLTNDPRQPAPYYFKEQRHNADLSGASVPVTIGGIPLWVQVSEDLAHRDVLFDNVVADFLPRVAWITAPILLLLLVIEIVTVRMSLRPVVAASDLAAKIGPMTTDIRLPEARLPGEIQPLVHAINAALDRLEQGFKAQRDFTADAAHELRTPLAILRTNIDLIPDQEVARTLRQDVDMMSRLVNQLLNFAELETLVIRPDEIADLHVVCAEVAAYVAPLAVKQNKSLAVPDIDARVLIHGNTEVLGQAVRNLVENALTHTPPGSTVEIEVTPEPAIYVRDQGPGVPEAERELIFRRFWRRDRRRRGTSGGLGLSIVSRIAEAHRASVSVANQPQGGAVFAIRFDPATRVSAAPKAKPDARDSVATPPPRPKARVG